MLQEKLAELRVRVQQAIARRKEAKVTGAEVQIIAVTKNHPAQIVTDSLAVGLTNIGENRVQEAKHKKEELPAGGIWHLIGHLQTNKIKQAVELFDVIQSVDSAKVLQCVNKEAAKLGKRQAILLQVNIAREEQKSGLLEEEYMELLQHLAEYPAVEVKGLMVIAQATEQLEETRPVFARGYELFVELQKQLGAQQCTMLSMGMTHDFEIAVEEGANYIRVGTGLFGARDYSIN